MPNDVEAVYRESRDCFKVNAHTAAILSLRKLLMHVAVEKGAPENESFKHYVEYLDKNGLLGVGGKAWVEKIKNKGNDANHEIVIMTKQDAEDVLAFAEMLLKLVYEFPGRVTPPAPKGP